MTTPKTRRPTVAEYVAELVAAAPPPSAGQITILRGLLGPHLPQRSSR